MQHDLPALLSALGASGLQLDDVIPVVVMDPETGGIVSGEIRRGGEDDESLECEIVRFDADERRETLCMLRAEPEAGAWHVVRFTVTGKSVPTPDDNAISFARGMMDEIKAGRVPDLGKLLQDHLGLKPIVGYR